jgi:pyrroloquinoline quinone biosynthesis protein D
MDDASVPRLATGVRLRHDAARGRWVVLAPERVVVPDETAVDVLRRVDGAASVTAIVDALAGEYDAPAGQIRRDVLELLVDLEQRGLIAV